MSKRITSLLLSLVLLASLIATAIPAFAGETVDLKVTANKTTATSGETIDYQIIIGAVNNLGVLEFDLKIPSGLKIVDSTIKTASDLATVLDSDGAIVIPAAKNDYKWSYSAQSDGYTGTEDLVLLDFSCTVEENATGALTVSVEVVDFKDNDTLEDIAHRVVTTTVNILKPATEIKLNKSETTIYTGNTETLTATVEPVGTTDTVAWESNNTDVAKVDNTGKVTAVAPGTAVITAKAGDKSATCTVTVEKAPCTHSDKINHPAKDSTCKDKGWDAYDECKECHQLFDKTGNKIDAIPYRALSTTHTPAQTATEEYLKTPATCTSAAVYYEHCSVCGTKLDTTFTSGALKAHTESGWKMNSDGHWKICTECKDVTTEMVAHTPDHEGHATEEYAIKCAICGYEIEAQLGHTHRVQQTVEANPYTCTTDGNQRYYICKCGEWFWDADCHNKITNHADVVEKAPGHDWKDATCTEPKTCKRPGCGATEGTALGHKLTKTGAKAATCTEAGSSEYYTCTTCGKFFSDAAGKNEITQDSWVIAALGHKVTKTDAKAATCTEAGNGEYYTCTACGKFFSDAAGENEITKNSWVINALGHTLTKTGAKAATCTEAGNSEYYTCATCGKFFSDAAGKNEITQDSWVIDALGHKMSDWKGDSEGHWQECLNCDRKTEKMPHEPDRDAPTVNDPVKCKVCGYELMPVLPTVKVEIPFTVTVKQGGNVAPGKQSFELEVFNIGNGNTGEYSDVTVTAAVETNGKGDYTAKLVISGSEEQVNAFISEGFYVREKNTGATGWTYSDAVWHVMFEDSLPTVYPTTVKTDANGASYEDGEAVENNTMAFVNTYTMNETVKPTPDTPADTPKTGDTGVTVWLVALPVAALTAAVVIGKKKHENE